MPDGYQTILDDHHRISDLLERYREAPDDALAHAACEAIARHARAEEELLYPAARQLGPGEPGTEPPPDEGDGTTLADRAELEHSVIGTLSAQILAAPPADLEGLMADLATKTVAHMAFEEEEILPRVRPLLDANELGVALAAFEESLGARSGEPMY